MIIQNKLGEVRYVDDQDMLLADEQGLFGVVGPNSFDAIGLENFFHTVPKDELEILICLYLGMKPKEIVAAFKYENMTRFYQMTARLRKTYREGKAVFLS